MIAGTLTVNVVANTADLESSSKRSKQALSDVTTAATTAKGALGGLSDSATKTSSGLGSMHSLTVRVREELHGLTEEAGKTVAAFFGFEAAKRTLESLLAAGEGLERSRIGLESFAGSARKGDEAMALVNAQALKLGLDLVILTDSYRGLEAASRNTALTEADTAKMFVQVTDGARAMGLTSQQTAELVNVFTASLSRGEISARQLHGSLQAYPGLQNLLAKTLGITNSELRAMSAEHLLAATVTLPALAREIGSVGEESSKAASTLDAAKTRMANAYAELGHSILEGPLGKALIWLTETQAKAFRNLIPIPALAQPGNTIFEAAKASPTGQGFDEAVARRNIIATQLEQAQATLAAAGPADPMGNMARDQALAQVGRLTVALAEQNKLVAERYTALTELTTTMQEQEKSAREAAEHAKASADAAKAQAGALDDARHLQGVLAEKQAEYQRIQERAQQALRDNPQDRSKILERELQDLEKLKKSTEDLMTTSRQAAGAQGVPANLMSLFSDAAARAARSDIDAYVVAAVTRVESNFDPNAVSVKGAQGLMQLMPGTSAQMGVTNPFDPTQNVMGGTKYLAQLTQKYGSLEQGLLGYVWGPGNLDQYGAEAAPPGAQKYVKDVLAQATSYRAQGAVPGGAMAGVPSPAPEMQKAIQRVQSELADVKIQEALVTEYFKLQNDLAKQMMTPQEFEATAPSRAAEAAKQMAVLKGEMATAPSLIRPSMEAANRGLQEILDASFAGLTLEKIREKLGREVDATIAELQLKAQSIQHELPAENLALKNPDLAAQLGIRPSEVTAAAGELTISPRLSTVSQQIPGLLKAQAEGDEDAVNRYIAAAKKLNDVQALQQGNTFLQQLKDQGAALSMSTADLQKYTLVKLGMPPADVAMAESLRQTVVELQAVHTLTSGVADEFITMATSGKISFASVAQSFTKMALDLAIQASDLKKVLGDFVIKALGLGVSTLGGGPGTSQGPVEGPIQQAAGGPTAARMTYLIGEEGPELFVPRVGAAKMIGLAGPALWSAPSAGMIVPLPRLTGMPRLASARPTFGGARAAGGPVEPYAGTMPSRFYDTASAAAMPASSPSGSSTSSRQGHGVVINFNIQTPSVEGFQRSQAEILQRAYRTWQSAQRNM